MMDVFVGIICALVAVAVAVWIAVLFVMVTNVIDNYRKRSSRQVALPPPDKAAERMYGQQYFERAIGRKNK